MTDMRSDRERVKARWPSARAERRGLTFVAIMARSGGRDDLLGAGATETAAWMNAASRLDEEWPV